MNNETILINSLNLRFYCEYKEENGVKIDITNSVYKKYVYFNDYIYIIKGNIEKFVLFESDGVIYKNNIEYNLIIVDGDKIYNINSDNDIIINIPINKLYLNKSLKDVDNELTNIINNFSIINDEPCICFIIALKYVRGYDSYIKIYVDNIQKFYKNSFIVIVDNNSTYIKDIEIVLKNYKNLIILTNTSDSKYEVGAYKFGLKWLIDNSMINYDYYVFTQDTFILENKYDFNKLKYLNVQACSIVEHLEHFTWYCPMVKLYILQKHNISINNINICWGCNFVISKNKIFNLYEYIKQHILKIKDHSCLFERVMGFFIKELEPKNFNIDGFLFDYESKNRLHYFKKKRQTKYDIIIDSNNIPIIKDNIITIKNI